MRESEQYLRRDPPTEVAQNNLHLGMPRLVTKLCHNMLSRNDETMSIKSFIRRSEVEEGVQTAVQKCKSKAWGLILSKTPLPGKGYKLPPRDGLAAAAFRLTIQGEKCKAEKLEELFAGLTHEGSLTTHLEAAVSLLLLLQNSSPGEEDRGPAEVGDCVDRWKKVEPGKYSHYSEAMFQFSEGNQKPPGLFVFRGIRHV